MTKGPHECPICGAKSIGGLPVKHERNCAVLTFARKRAEKHAKRSSHPSVQPETPDWAKDRTAYNDYWSDRDDDTAAGLI